MTFRFKTMRPALGVLIVTSMMTATAVAGGRELPKAETILDGHVKATGGKEAHAKLKSRKQTGTLAVRMGAHEFEASAVVHATAPNQWHLELESDGIFHIVRASDGKQAWEVRDGEARVLDGGEKRQILDQARFHATAEWRKAYTGAETSALATVNGKPAWEVLVTTKSGDQLTQFYDKDSGRLIKTSRTVESQQLGELAVDIFYGEYAEFDGVWLPTAVKQVLKDVPGIGEGIQTWTYTDIQHNVDVPSGLFDAPEQVKAARTP